MANFVPMKGSPPIGDSSAANEATSPPGSPGSVRLPGITSLLNGPQMSLDTESAHYSVSPSKVPAPLTFPQQQQQQNHLPLQQHQPQLAFPPRHQVFEQSFPPQLFGTHAQSPALHPAAIPRSSTMPPLHPASYTFPSPSQSVHSYASSSSSSHYHPYSHPSSTVLSSHDSSRRRYSRSNSGSSWNMKRRPSSSSGLSVYPPQDVEEGRRYSDEDLDDHEMYYDEGSSSVRRSIRGRKEGGWSSSRPLSANGRITSRSHSSSNSLERGVPAAEEEEDEETFKFETGGESDRTFNRTRTLMTSTQLAALMALWNETKFPTTPQRRELAERIGLTARKVQVWFQNQRQKARRTPNSTVPSRPVTGGGGASTAAAAQAAPPLYAPQFYQHPYTSASVYGGVSQSPQPDWSTSTSGHLQNVLPPPPAAFQPSALHPLGDRPTRLEYRSQASVTRASSPESSSVRSFEQDDPRRPSSSSSSHIKSPYYASNLRQSPYINQYPPPPSHILNTASSSTRRPPDGTVPRSPISLPSFSNLSVLLNPSPVNPSVQDPWTNQRSGLPPLDRPVTTPAQQPQSYGLGLTVPDQQPQPPPPQLQGSHLPPSPPQHPSRDQSQ